MGRHLLTENENHRGRGARASKPNFPTRPPPRPLTTSRCRGEWGLRSMGGFLEESNRIVEEVPSTDDIPWRRGEASVEGSGRGLALKPSSARHCGCAALGTQSVNIARQNTRSSFLALSLPRALPLAQCLLTFACSGRSEAPPTNHSLSISNGSPATSRIRFQSRASNQTIPPISPDLVRWRGPALVQECDSCFLISGETR